VRVRGSNQEVYCICIHAQPQKDSSDGELICMQFFFICFICGVGWLIPEFQIKISYREFYMNFRRSACRLGPRKVEKKDTLEFLMNENLEFFYWVVWYPAVCIKGFARVLLPSAAIIFLLPTSISDPWTPTPKEAFPCYFSFIFLFLCEFSNPWQVVCRSPSSYESNDSSQASIGSPSRKPGIRGSLARFSRPHPSRNERPFCCDLHRHCQVHPSTSSSFIVGELALTEASQPRRSFFSTFLGPNLHADLLKFI